VSEKNGSLTDVRVIGRKRMASSSAVICGLARDCSKSLRKLIPALEELAAKFHSCQFLIVENDSHDETGRILSAWAERNEAVRSIRYCYVAKPESGRSAKNGNMDWFDARRIERISFARNLYLDELQRPEMVSDFVVVIDLDIRSFSQGGLEHSFGMVDHWDVVTASGLRVSARSPFSGPVYWDSYAFEPITGFRGRVQTEDQIRDNQIAISKALSDGAMLPAHSAFGGLAIYRGELLHSARYAPLPNPDKKIPVLCEHIALHRSIRMSRKNCRLMVNPHLVVRYSTARDLLRRVTSYASDKR
jgi:hypothetical protein